MCIRDSFTGVDAIARAFPNTDIQIDECMMEELGGDIVAELENLKV